ncbi:hypothetical protein [Clostridium sp.]|uniref:hypothetical protein n=1 Tax=Clostridium sp. TaxID=1506 RepID=UPI003D6CAA94
MKIVKEIRTALKELKIDGPYILMPHSISGIYSMYYAINYPKEVEAIIGIDMSTPNQTKNHKNANMSPDLTLLNTFGIVRGITYLLPSVDDGINKNNYYSSEQVKINKIATAWNSSNISVINENTEQLYDVKYPNKLPVLSFLSTDSVHSNKEWLPLHKQLISNSDIQKIEVLSGNHYLHWTNADKIVKVSNEFISTYIK